jgi:hypothetical protein
MQAVAVFPGKPNSVHLAHLSKPSLDEIPNEPCRVCRSQRRAVRPAQ